MTVLDLIRRIISGDAAGARVLLSEHPDLARAAVSEGASRATSKLFFFTTPLHLAVCPTGHRGTGSPASLQQQARIIELLLSHGASWNDEDLQGKPVHRLVRAAWIREKYALG